MRFVWKVVKLTRRWEKRTRWWHERWAEEIFKMSGYFWDIPWNPHHVYFQLWQSWIFVCVQNILGVWLVEFIPGPESLLTNSQTSLKCWDDNSISFYLFPRLSKSLFEKFPLENSQVSCMYLLNPSHTGRMWHKVNFQDGQ